MTTPLAVELVEELIATRNQADAELEAFKKLRQSYEDDLNVAYQEISFLHSQARVIDRQLDEAGPPFMIAFSTGILGGFVLWGAIIAAVLW